ncbi:preprotein translocase subunit SecG [Paracoccus siganidrum]|nr:preprotein translocase subunit SecG [Paracoccus siganidrum]RMC41066.1 preprotein translocase subunit SecG [Paracoccus siganidrum]
MENVVLTVHLILAVLLTGVVLLQRSEGGGLGMGGGGNVMTGRQAANAMTRLTWICGIALFVTSVALTVIAARQTSTGSIMDQLGVPQQEQSAPGTPTLPTYTPPPSTGGDPLTPPSPDAAGGATAPAPATEAPAAEAPAAQTPEAPATEAVAPPAPAEEAPAADAPAPQGGN